MSKPAAPLAAISLTAAVLLLVDVMDGRSLPPPQEAQRDELRRDG